MDMTEEDKMLSDAARDFLNRADFSVGQLVRLKKNLHLFTLGDTDKPYTGNFAFIQWVNSIVGTDDNPLGMHNVIIGDCLVMAHNGRGTVNPVLVDSRFIEPAVQSVARCDFSRNQDGLPG
jgi:hypothetical protein